jgi:hypothetical protein
MNRQGRRTAPTQREQIIDAIASKVLDRMDATQLREWIHSNWDIHPSTATNYLKEARNRIRKAGEGDRATRIAEHAALLKKLWQDSEGKPSAVRDRTNLLKYEAQLFGLCFSHEEMIAELHRAGYHVYSPGQEPRDAIAPVEIQIMDPIEDPLTEDPALVFE